MGEWGFGLESLGSKVELGVAVCRSRSRSRNTVDADVAIRKLLGLCGGSLVSMLAGDDFALGQIIGDGLLHGSGVHGTAADVPVHKGEKQNTHGVNASVVHLLRCE